MRRFLSVVRFAPLFTIGSMVLMLLAVAPGSTLLVDKTGFFKATKFAGGVQLFIVLGFGGWFALIESLERVEGAWQSLDASDRDRGRWLMRAAGLWVWGYCVIWAVWTSLFAADRLPYMHPAFWVVAGAAWCGGLWMALIIRRRTNDSLFRDRSSASAEPPVVSSR